MNYNKLRTELEEVLAGKHDARFDDIRSRIFCMSTSRVYAVINAVVSCMDSGEMYVEVGTFQGGSIISALQGNNAQAIGVDSFHEFTKDNSKEITRGNLEKFGVSDRVALFDMRYQDYFGSIPTDFKIAVYNYDGEHGYEPQLAGMEAAWSHLRKGSVIIVDDYFYPEVTRAVNQFIANHIDRVKVLLIVDSLNETNAPDPVWWNGVVCLRVL
jgi:predicted O-methyltransferase YrrM